MDEITYGIVVCENCYNIPEITILNKNKVKLKCPKCIDIKIKDFSYFDKFRKNIERESWSDMPKCNFNKNIHEESISSEYCLQCEKYLCKECKVNHQNCLGDKNHIFIKQKISCQYYCNKNGHEDIKFNRFCKLCNDYLCFECKCCHKNSFFTDFENNLRLNEIKDKIKKSQKIIEDEEKKLNVFVEELENKIKNLKNMFKDYKERNLKIICLYNLLINNYEHFNNIRNYNLYNNIAINDNFDFESSEYFVKEKNKKVNECIASKYNKLYSFYKNKSHIRTKAYINHFITKKFCQKSIIKKCIILNENIIGLIFNDNNFIYFLDKENKINYEIIKKKYNCKYIIDIYALNSKELLLIDENNIPQIYNVNKDKISYITTKYKEKNFNFIIPNLINKHYFFMVSNNEEFFSMYYYINNKNIPMIYKENKDYNIKCLFENIYKIISDYKLNSEDENKLKKIFNNQNKLDIENLLKLDYDLLKIIDNLFEELYRKLGSKFNEHEQNKYKINSNYIYQLIKNKLNNNSINLTKEEKINLNYILNFYEVCYKIRKIYCWCIVLNTKINNIYNLNNQNLIFMGEKYLFIIYLIKEKEFSPIMLPSNFYSNNANNLNNYEINNISSNYIILNNKESKNINFIDIYNFCILNQQFNYFNNVSINDNYLLFDNIKENEIQFNLINLKDMKNEKDNELLEFFNFKITNYFPKILINNNFEKFIFLYENNQLCIADYITDNNKIIKESTGQIKNIKEINIKKNDVIIPKIDSCSEVYSSDYDASKLFSNDALFSNDIYSYYYCSKNPSNQFIIFDCTNEYYFNSFQITYLSRKKDCKPKNFQVSILDYNKNIINIYNFVNKDINSLSEEYILKNKGRYLKFDLIDNYGGNYIIIKNLKFYANPIDSIQLYPLI